MQGGNDALRAGIRKARITKINQREVFARQQADIGAR